MLLPFEAKSVIQVLALIIIKMVIISVVISVAPYLTDKGEHTALYKINKNAYIKTLKRIMLYSHNIV